MEKVGLRWATSLPEVFGGGPYVTCGGNLYFGVSIVRAAGVGRCNLCPFCAIPAQDQGSAPITLPQRAGYPHLLVGYRLQIAQRSSIWIEAGDLQFSPGAAIPVE